MRPLILIHLLAFLWPIAAQSDCMSLEVEEPWIQLTEERTDDEQVVSPETSPELITCIDPIFTEKAHGAIVEAQFVIVVRLIIAADGRIERFQVLRRPIFGMALSAPLGQALRKWRFSAIENGSAVCMTIVLSKERGRRTCDPCTQGHPKR